MKKIVITMGDPAGIGAEIIVKFFNYMSCSKNRKNNIYAVCGTKSILEFYIKKLGYNLIVKEIDEKNINSISDLSLNEIPVFNFEKDVDKVNIGEISKEAGQLTMMYLDKGIELVNSKVFDALVTAPLSKDSINKAGYRYSGHTSYLADRFKTKDFAMILKGKKIIVILNTTHLSLEDAVKKVKKQSILEKIILADKAKQELGLNGKIAIAGLNPHNGENGLFGNEESEEIFPAVEEALKLGIDVEGPIVPDTLFVKMLRDKYCIAVVMYHDQGLIPMKMESFGQGVNITIGLPIIRTSVDHGTAFDIAGQGIADYGSMKEAVETAEKIIDNRV